MFCCFETSWWRGGARGSGGKGRAAVMVAGCWGALKHRHLCILSDDSCSVSTTSNNAHVTALGSPWQAAAAKTEEAARRPEEEEDKIRVQEGSNTPSQPACIGST